MRPTWSFASVATPHRPWALWLALLLAFFGALAPTLSHALNHARGDRSLMVEVCTSSGPRWMALAQAPSFQADAPDVPASAQVLDHCPFCLHLADRVAPPPSLLLHLFQVEGGQQEAPVWQAFFFFQSTSLRPPTRAPPHST
jgi:hypothetical protein